MKKEGIQTRNRKLTSKKKKKNGFGITDIKPLEKGFPGFGHTGGGFSHLYYGSQMHGGSMAGQFMASQQMHGMGSVPGMSLGLSPSAAASLGLSSGFCTVAA